MTNYLENSVCMLRPLFNIDYTKKQNILSVCLFKMTNGYKNFAVYLNGLDKLNKYIETRLVDFRIRLFIDKNIYDDIEIMDRLKVLSMVDMVLYECSDFMVDGFHDGLFGTMVRFFPMFDFPNNDSGVVGIMDADFKEETADYYYTVYETFERVKTDAKKLSNIYLYFYGRLFHIAAKDIKTTSLRAYALASKVFNIKKIPYKVLTDYIYEVKNSAGDKIYSDYTEGRTINIGQTAFIFGVDEYFINNTLLSYFDKNLMCYAFRYSYQLFSPLFFVYSDNKDPVVRKNLELIVDFILEKVKFIHGKSLIQKLKFIEKKLYINPEMGFDPELTSFFYYLNSQIYLSYAILRKKKLYDVIKKNISNFIFKQNFGYLSIEKIEYVNCPGEQSILFSGIKLPKKYIQNIVDIFTDKVSVDNYFINYQVPNKQT